MFKNLFGKQLSDSINEKAYGLLDKADNTLFYLSLIGIGILLYDLGFVHREGEKETLSNFYVGYSLLLFLILTLRLLLAKRHGVSKGWFVVEYVLVLLLVGGIIVHFLSDQFFGGTGAEQFITRNFFTSGLIVYTFLIELSKRSINLYRIRFNPALLFVFSFLILIFIGTGLLLLPRATVGGITLLDALFTSTSAVCVTGLIVVDTATYFTLFGKIIILILIQLGALGIITFTSFLAMFFEGNASFRNQLFMQNIMNEEKLGETMRTVGKIVVFTFTVEAVGAAFIYATISDAAFAGVPDRIGFSVFHAISAFCNAGFSTMTAGLNDVGFRYNYDFQLVIICLIILGGIGFPILFNLYGYLMEVSRNRFRQVNFDEKYVHTSRIVTVNTKIVLITTAVLLVAGTIIYFITEYNSTLADHTGYGKFVTSLFGSVTPRTAGFNTVDMTQLTLPLVLVYLLLMWIGASPGSTGGGIKTTTFALAVMNTVSIAR
ncbi:potassium transporter TrkG [Pontibacter pamirensis]|uniref:potassium transporter TrkG n=1 Tax=Pontibacter pamirensis TaxID=2562824 RepID=UPI00192E2F03|nr:potassium transporter TrkG [Pontibacter pamirensis]